jgi:hypothetical protein
MRHIGPPLGRALIQTYRMKDPGVCLVTLWDQRPDVDSEAVKTLSDPVALRHVSQPSRAGE